MLDTKEIHGAGFTMIVEDMSVVNDLPMQTQENINTMFEELQEVLNKYNLDICIVASQEDAKRFQGRSLLNDMINKMDKLCLQDSKDFRS